VMTPQPPAAGPDYPEEARDARDLDRGYRAAASVIRSLTRHLGELDTADLPTFDGKSVRIVSLVEVEQWLEGCAVRVTNGEVL
jgi:hypothetical protein